MSLVVLAVGALLLAAGIAVLGYLGLVTGKLTLDLGIGRRTRPLGPHVVDIAAPRELVYDIVAQPYLGRTTHAQREKVRVLEPGTDLVLAAHYTRIGAKLRAQTVETVRFSPPDTVDFRLVRGPVPHVTERFALADHDGGTRLTYTGEMAGDGWALGARWTAAVARKWEATVATSLAAVKAEAERRHR
jgi:hypothetical protein